MNIPSVLRPGRTACALGLAAALCSGTALAQTSAANPPAGRLLASNCFQCHGTNGKGPGFDKLAGESASEIYKEMLEMRSGKEDKGIMSAHAKGYTDAQLRALSQYLSTQR